METKTILIIGATGTFGRYITQGLTHQNFRIKALARDSFKARLIHPPSVELIQGDVFNISDLENALDGVDGIYINLNACSKIASEDRYPMIDGLKNLLIVCRIHNVKHVMMHTLINRSFPMPDKGVCDAANIHNRSVELLKNSGLPYTIFNCSLFFENFLHNFRNGNNIRILGNGSFPIHWISAIDFGKQASKAFFNEEALNQEFSIQGTEAWTLQDAAELYVNQHKSEKLRLTKLSGNLLRLLVRIRPALHEKALWFDRVNSYPEKFQSENAWKLFGVPPTTLSEFAREGNLTKSRAHKMPNFYKASVSS